MAKILIAGYGKLGQPLANELARDGHAISAIKRHTEGLASGQVNLIKADLCDVATLKNLATDFDLLILILTPQSRSAEGYQQVYQGGIGNLLQHFTSAGQSPPCLFVSATSVYAQNQGEWVDETSETKPTSYNGQSLLAAEQRVLKFSSDSVVVRFSGIYGPDRQRLLKQLHGPLAIQQTPPSYSNRIHQQDCVGVLGFLCRRRLAGNPLASIYLASDHDPAPKYDMMCWLADHSGLPRPKPLLAGPEANQNKRCSNQRLLEAGYQFHYRGFRDGYSKISIKP